MKSFVLHLPFRLVAVTCTVYLNQEMFENGGNWGISEIAQQRWSVSLRIYKNNSKTIAKVAGPTPETACNPRFQATFCIQSCSRNNVTIPYCLSLFVFKNLNIIGNRTVQRTFLRPESFCFHSFKNYIVLLRRNSTQLHIAHLLHQLVIEIDFKVIEKQLLCIIHHQNQQPYPCGPSPTGQKTRWH